MLDAGRRGGDRHAGGRLHRYRQRAAGLVPPDDDRDDALAANLELDRLAGVCIRRQAGIGIEQRAVGEDVAEGEREVLLQVEAVAGPHIEAVVGLGELGEQGAVETCYGAEADRIDVDCVEPGDVGDQRRGVLQAVGHQQDGPRRDGAQRIARRDQPGADAGVSPCHQGADFSGRERRRPDQGQLVRIIDRREREIDRSPPC